jgi:hypothetical protein
MKTVNAGIKTVEEAMIRMIGGEVFYDSSSHNKIYYDKSYVRSSSPFRLSLSTVKPYILWDRVREWEVEVIWYENIEKPVLCWVSDIDPSLKENPDLIIVYNDNQYCTWSASWKYATPVTKEDLL